MKENVLKSLCIIILSTIVTWGLMGFVFWNWNFSTWDQLQRLALVLTAFIVSCFAICAFFEIFSENKGVYHDYNPLKCAWLILKYFRY